MTIRDAVMAQQSPKTSCRVCIFLKRQDAAEVAEWQELLAESAEVVQHKSISVVMSERAQAMRPPLPAVSPDAVGKHRAGNHDSLAA